MNEKYIQMLRDTIKAKHGCVSRYSETIAVKEELDGKTIWEGKVEVFDLAGHPKAAQAYAWGYDDHDGRKQYVTVLKATPIDSAARLGVRRQRTKMMPAPYSHCPPTPTHNPRRLHRAYNVIIILADQYLQWSF